MTIPIIILLIFFEPKRHQVMVRLHLLFLDAFSTLNCIFKVIIVITEINVTSLKIQCSAENGHLNGKWQLSFNWVFLQVKAAN